MKKMLAQRELMCSAALYDLTKGQQELAKAHATSTFTANSECCAECAEEQLVMPIRIHKQFTK